MKNFVEETIQCIDSRFTPCDPGRRNTVLCMLVSGILGWAIGFALIEVIGAGALFQWELMPLLPIFNGVGWSLLGMIVGGSGLFDSQRTPKWRNRRPHPQFGFANATVRSRMP